MVRIRVHSPAASPRRPPRVVQRIHRRRHDVRARAPAPFDVRDRLIGAKVAGGHVGHRVAVRQGRVDVEVAVTPVSAARPANVAASRPAFSGEAVMTPASSKPGKAVADRMAVAPVLPVPQTTTRLVRLTLVGVLDPPVADITRRRKASSMASNGHADRPDQPSGWLASRNLLDSALRSSYQPV
jgi:hypothetical protein